MRRLIIYVHGKGGSAEEAKHYQPLFPDSDVIGVDYHAQTPWEAKDEFSRFFDLHSEGYHSVILIASSIGAYRGDHPRTAAVHHIWLEPSACKRPLYRVLHRYGG